MQQLKPNLIINKITNTLKRALKLGIPETVITPSPFASKSSKIP